MHIGGVSVLDIVERFGTPVYVYDESVILRQIENVKKAFAGLPFRPFYAMKANSNVPLLRLIRAHGFGCDAVSPGEIFLAQQAGYEPPRRSGSPARTSPTKIFARSPTPGSSST